MAPAAGGAPIPQWQVACLGADQLTNGLLRPRLPAWQRGG